MDFTTLLAFSLYFGVLIIIGIWSTMYSRSHKDFLLGARSINYWVTAIAAHASDMSAWLFMGLPAAIYLQGLSASWIAIGLIAGMLASWHFIAQKLRIQTEQYDTLTLSAFLEKRFNDSSGLLRIASGCMSIFFFTVYIAAGLTGMGFIFETVFSVPYHTGMFFGLVATLFYLLVGGFLAIAWSHFFQGMFLLCVIVFVPFYAYISLTNSHVITLFAQARGVILSPIPTDMHLFLLQLFNGLAWGLGYLGMPHIVVNYMGINNPDHIQRAKYVGMTWLVISLTAAIAIGYIAIGYFPALINSELVFVNLVQELYNPFVGGIILCAILAATMSTIDTQILVASTALAHDVLPKFLTLRSEKIKMQSSRISIGLIALASFLVAAQKSASVMGYVTYAWSGLASSFSPAIVLSLYGKPLHRFAILAGMISGALVAGLWPLIDASIVPLLPGFISNCFITYLASRLYTKN